MKRKSLKPIIASCTAFVSLLAILLSNNRVVFELGADVNENYTLTLDYEDAPTSETTFQEEVIANADNNSFASFKYINVAGSSNNLCTLAENGSIEKIDAANGLKSITVNYDRNTDTSSDLYLSTKVNAGDEYTQYVVVPHNTPIPFEGNYFKLTTINGVTISNIKIEYDCNTPIKTEVFNYQYTDYVSDDWVFNYGSTTERKAYIYQNGTTTINAIDTERDNWGYRNSTTEMTKTSDIGNAQSTNGVVTIGILGEDKATSKYTSRILFPFVLEGSARVTISAFLSAASGANLSPLYATNRANNVSCWASINSTYLNSPNVAFNGVTDFKECNYGTHYLEKGNHIFMLEFFNNSTPDVDCIQLKVDSFNEERGFSFDPMQDSTATFDSIALMSPCYGKKTYNPGYIGAHASATINTDDFLNAPVEGTSVTNIAGLTHYSEIKLRINIPAGGAYITPTGYYAGRTSSDIGTVDFKDYAKLHIDGVAQDKSNFSSLTITTTSEYHDFKEFSFGTYFLEEGVHTITFSQTLSININKFTLKATLKSLVVINGTIDYSLEAEDSRIDHSTWIKRASSSQTSFTENWTTTHTTEYSSKSQSGVCVNNLDANSVINLPFGIKGSSYSVQLQMVVASNTGLYASELMSVSLDGEAINGVEDKVLGSYETDSPTTSTTFWNWKIYSLEFKTLDPGVHTFSIKLNHNFNIDSFIIIAR